MNQLLLVAGGSGSRFGGDLPKQYQDLDGVPVILRSLECFLRFDPGIRIAVVIGQGHRSFWEGIIRGHPREREIWLCEGGRDRFESVKRGLELVEDEGLVGIHDAVRPLVSAETIARAYRSADEAGSGIPVMEMDESVRMLLDGERSENLERARLRRVQTPQVFRAREIKMAYTAPPDVRFTDDAAVYESWFGHLNLVEGNRENLKITTSNDLKLASLLL